MSDLVRGIHRGAEEPPAREAPPAASPPAGPPPPAEAPPRVHFPTEPAAAPPAAAAPEPEPEPTPTEEALPAEAATGDGAEQLFTELLAFSGRLPGLVREGREFPWGWLERLLERVIRSLEGSADVFWLANNPPSGGADYLSAHMTSVGVLSLQIGRGLAYDRDRLLDLGMAAFVFDIGIAGLPAGADSAAYQTHAQLGAEIVRRWAPPRAGVVEAILQHHERENGRGYPQGLAGAAIHPNAKIIALMDTYTALIFPRPPGRRLPPHEAIREIVRSKHEDFATPLIKALLVEISVFPPRTVVRLNTGEVGRVIAVNRDHPLRPKVEIVADPKGNPLPAPKILDLSEAPFIYVTGPVEER
jgi:hypothetical protein